MHEHARLRAITVAEFTLLGVEQLAYVKPVTLRDGTAAYAVHSANGQEIEVFDDREVAFAAVIQNGLEPASVH